MEQIGYIDWERAKQVGQGLVPVGPKRSVDEIMELVGQLRQAVAAADAHIAEVTRLNNPLQSSVLILDRRSWIESCVSSGKAIFSQIGVAATPDKRREILAGTGRGAQVGAVFAAVATRILGQFDPFSEPARLVIVAPNVLEVENQLMVDAADFRLWVSLHEQTHRYQFGHAPWLRWYVLGLLGELLEADEELNWKRGATQSGASIINMVMGPAQIAIFDKISAVMSLSEGHADVMMDAVGVKVVPTLPLIRKVFENRRDRRGWTGIIGKLLGNDLKLAQYRDGAAFCREVIDKAGVDTLNIAFSGPEAVPSLAEVHDPQAWLDRIS